MVPSQFLALPALPMIPNGKVDRAALARTAGVALTVGTDYVAPTDDLERRLAVI